MESTLSQLGLDKWIGERIDQARRTDDAFLVCIEEEREGFVITDELLREWSAKDFEILNINEEAYHTPGLWALRTGFVWRIHRLLEHLCVTETGFMYVKPRIGADF